MQSFDIQPVNRFRGSKTAIRRPKEFACFSYDEDHKYHADAQSLRYYYPPKIGADLSQGFNEFRQLDDSKDEHIDSLLTTLVSHERETGRKLETDIVTWRGMITKIMAAPFDNFGSGFEMNATCFQGTIFMEENHEYKMQSRQAQKAQTSRPGAPSQDMMSYWGYKFETLCLLPDTWDSTSREYIESRENEQVSNLAQYCSIVKTGIGDAKMILAGEVDAVWDEKPSKPEAPINWVELKTSASINSDKDMIKYERKLLKFWVQSFLLGVPRIVVGFRSPDGILQRLEHIETQSIPSLVQRKGKGTWDGNTCINFTAIFLSWLKDTVKGDGVWRIRRQDRSPRIEVFKVQDSGHGRILTEEFLNWRNNDDRTSTDAG